MKKIIGFGLMFAVAGLVHAVEPAGAAHAKRGEKFKAADTDGDGKLSAAEFSVVSKRGEATAVFAKIDADGDGFATREEMKAAHEARGGKGGRGGKCEGGKCQKGGAAGGAPKA